MRVDGEVTDELGCAFWDERGQSTVEYAVVLAAGMAMCAALAVLCFGMGYCGFARRCLNKAERAFCFVAAVAFCEFLFDHSPIAIGVGSAAFAMLAFTQIRTPRSV